MGAKNKRKKPVKIVDAEVSDDGCIVIEMNVAVPLGNSKKVLLPPETLFALAEEYGSMPPAASTDYPGVPVIEVEDVFSESDEDSEEPEEDEDLE